ncbi:AglZ/HisF2 family acetamidino modification protein [Sphingomonas sp. LM7]|uniref:AglZ/HisF2 family acetamidino modification protein n=1 Tax=Sphingomonas sp. LM7 TaxID=1938607 RepID=UPI000983EA33|nr:AglZ/HisF2 family acetamidino modification protein [Sphingomonas sp. LM7]AQR75542.1 imidazole glycerol phosphate synthase subunit HisF [Sphingomonas sp. LM7]
MLTHRVIPCLLLSESRGGLVKTMKFGKPKYVGDPINAVKIFNEKEVDELMILDIDATRENRGPDFDLIEQLASECFMPLCYGGGIRTAEEALKLFSLGVEKVSLQSAVARNPGIVREIADHAGEQAVVVSIDVKRGWLGKLQAFSATGVKPGQSDWRQAVRDAVANGAGEILLNAVDRDGTLAGPDLELIREASQIADVPLVAVGGISSLADIKAATDAGASAVAAGAYFVFQGPHRAVLITYPQYDQLRALWSDAE